jgi:hypothetical protein
MGPEIFAACRLPQAANETSDTKLTIEASTAAALSSVSCAEVPGVVDVILLRNGRT